MNKKLMITAAALLAFSTLAGCSVKSGSGSNSAGGDSGNPDPSSSSQPIDTKVTVTFDLNYQGAPAPTTVQVEKNDYVDEPDDPTRDNYFFKGWYDTADASGEEFDFFLTPIVEDITLYADWAAAYNVTFYLNKPEAQEQEVYSSSVVEAGELVSRPVDPKIKGYTFGGWYENAACDDDKLFNFATAVSKNLDLYAKWNLPDWKVAQEAIEKYLGYLAEVEGVTVPQFPNSDYTVDDKYSDAIVISGPDKCATEYLPILEAAGYTVDAENKKASNDYIQLQLRENDDENKDQFELIISIKGTGDSKTFNAVPYKVGTQQNYLGIPADALSIFSDFTVYVGKLTTGDPCVSMDFFFEEQAADASPKLSDEQYWNSKVDAFVSALEANGYFTGHFTNTGELYFADKAYLTMNQVSNFDSSAPTKFDLLSYSYAGLYGAGVGYNKIKASAFADAVAAAPFNTTASLEVDFSSIAATYSANGKNFALTYDADEDQGQKYIEIDVLGITGTSFTPLNQLAAAVLNSLGDDWDVLTNAGESQTYAKYYAVHFAEKDGKKVADAQMGFDYNYDPTTYGALGLGTLAFNIIITPASAEWDAEYVNGYFAKQALNNDPAGLPVYTGDFAFFAPSLSQYGDALDILLLYTNEAEALAYVQALQNDQNNYALVDSQEDDSGKMFLLRSASTNFELTCAVSANSFEIYVDAAPIKEREFNNAELAAMNNILDARSAFTVPDDAVAAFTATYTKIQYSSYYDYEDLAGYSVVLFISNVASVEDGQENPVQNDVTNLINYYVAQGFSYNSRTGRLTKSGLTVTIKLVNPSDDIAFYCLQIIVSGNRPQPLPGSNGHSFQLSETTYLSDDGDAFIQGYISAQIKTKYPSMENSLFVSFYSTLSDKSVYVKTTTTVYTNLESYTIYYYNMENVLVDAASATAAAAAYKEALVAAGFQLANFTALSGSPEGYWNANSGEFVSVSASSASVNVRVFFIGSQYRGTVKVK